MFWKLGQYFIFICMLHCTIVESACIHDRLSPIKGISPQTYTDDMITVPTYFNAKSTVTKITAKPIKVNTGRVKAFTKTKLPIPPSTTHRVRRYVQDSVSNSSSDSIKNLEDNEESYGILYEQENPSQRSQYYESDNILPPNFQSDVQVNESYNTMIYTSMIPKIDSPKPNVSKLFKNIRVKPWLDDDFIEFKNDSVEFKRLMEGLDRAVDKIQKLLKVIPVKGRLLLRRQNACHRYWHTLSANGGKCGVMKTDYDGEKCLDDFKFPDEHLDGFSLYSAHDPEPVDVVHEDGVGVTETDLIVYIRATNTANCRKNKGVIAYASSCQTDQNDRPVAGFANFCPPHLNKENFDKEKFYLTVLHEFFHILGFSKTHFDNFRDCKVDMVPKNDGQNEGSDYSAYDDQSTTQNLEYKWEWVCDRREKSVVYMSSSYRMVTPAIMRETEQHFNCSNIGGPLDSAYGRMVKSSHWESRFFQGSLMTPNIGVPHITSLDVFTLAAFEDMGWYKVDFNQADPLPWGQGGGCDFGSLLYCHAMAQESPYFCSARDITYGCHYLHLDKGECITDDYLDTCSMYKANETSMCWDSRGNNNLTSLTGEVYSMASRCFVASLTKETVEGNAEGRCYQHRCNDSDTLEVKVGDSDWILCKDGDKIEIPGYKGTLYCPSTAVLCAPTINDFVAPSTVSPGESEASIPFCATVRMTFPSVKVIHTRGERVIQKFLSKFSNQITAVTDIDSGRIFNLTFVGSTIIEFLLIKNVDWSTLAPLTNSPTRIYKRPNAGEEKNKDHDQALDSFHASVKVVSCDNVIKRLLSSVQKGIFEVTLNGEIFMAKSMNITSPYESINNLVISMTMNEVERKKIRAIPHGTMAAAVVGTVCGAILLSVAVAIYYKSHVPRAVTPAPPQSGSVDARYLPQQRNASAMSTNSSVEIESVSHLTFNV